MRNDVQVHTLVEVDADEKLQMLRRNEPTGSTSVICLNFESATFKVETALYLHNIRHRDLSDYTKIMCFIFVLHHHPLL